MEDTLEKILRLLHPFMPYITEEIWHHLPGSGRSLLEAEWPEFPEAWLDDAAESTMKFLQDIISEVRTIRAENRIPVKDRVNLWLAGGQRSRSVAEPYQAAIRLLAGVENIEYQEVLPQDKRLLKGLAGTTEIGLLVAREINLEQEKERLEKELNKVQEDIDKLEARLSNPDFVAKAPASVVEEHRKRLDQLRVKKSALEKSRLELLAT